MDRSRLLLALHLGHTSRNRDFERFGRPSERRVLRAHRRLASLMEELNRPGTRLESRLPAGRRDVEVVCRNSALRYHRRVVLEPWEAEFLDRLLAEREARAGSAALP